MDPSLPQSGAPVTGLGIFIVTASITFASTEDWTKTKTKIHSILNLDFTKHGSTFIKILILCKISYSNNINEPFLMYADHPITQQAQFGGEGKRLFLHLVDS